ncbi:MAG: hypothetical protein AAFO07_01040 [Bacteroidota bacterium]
MKILNLLGLLLLVAFFSTCSQIEELDDVTRVQYDAEYAIPIATAAFTLTDILENFQDNATLVADPDGLFHFIYTGDIDSESGADILNTINEVLPPAVPIVSSRVAIPFPTPPDMEIDLITFREGEILYGFESTFEKPLTVTFRLPEFQRDGEVLTFVHEIPAYSGSGDPVRFTINDDPFSLAGYSVDGTSDTLRLEYDAISPDGDTAMLNNFLMRLQNLSASYAQGYLGTNVYDNPTERIPIDFFDDWIQGDVFFEDPKISYILENSFGIPTRSIVNFFNIITVEGDVLPLESDLIVDGIDFPYPTLDEVNEVKSTTFVFTKDNSNIEDILSSKPVEVEYDVDAITNPDMDRTIRGFITDESFYKVAVDVDLPFFGSAANYFALDTFDLDLGEYGNVDSIEFKFVAENELPLGIDAQAYLLDENGVVLDSIFDGLANVVEGAPVNESGDAIGTALKETFVTANRTRLDNIQNATQVALQASFSTTQSNQVSVKITADQSISFRIGAIVKIKN